MGVGLLLAGGANLGQLLSHGLQLRIQRVALLLPFEGGLILVGQLLFEFFEF